jgi:RNA polymerase sigma-70 factor, ECF subfamily
MVQECFVKLWRTAGRFDASRGSVGAYLFVIARSVAADIRKRPSSRPLLSVDEVHIPPQLDSVDQILDALIVREALETLSSAHLQVLRLAQDEGLTQSQIAERLGLPLGTVKTRMHEPGQKINVTPRIKRRQVVNGLISEYSRAA